MTFYIVQAVTAMIILFLLAQIVGLATSRPRELRSKWPRTKY